MLIAEEEKGAKTRRELDLISEMNEKNKKKKNKEALIDELVIICIIKEFISSFVLCHTALTSTQ